MNFNNVTNQELMDDFEEAIEDVNRAQIRYENSKEYKAYKAAQEWCRIVMMEVDRRRVEEAIE